MSPSTSPPRPRQVTLAAWLIMLGSVFVVLTVFERISGLKTLETQDSVQRFLSEPPGDGLGLGVQGVLDVLRLLAMVAGGCAAAAAILGYQVLQRSKSARVALSLLAAPLFVTGLVTGGFMSSVVVASAIMLWFQPSRDWFNGVTREPKPRPEPTPEAPLVPRTSEPRSFPGFGSAPVAGAQPGAVPAEQVGTPLGAQPASPYAPAGAGVRPTAVAWACALTWVFAGLAVVVMAASIAVLVASPDLVFDEVRRQNPDLAAQGVSDHLVVQLTYVLGAVIILWSLAAMVLAGLAFRGVAWARVPLVVSASLAAGLCLVAAISQFLMVLPLAACVVALALLLRPDVRAWFDAQRAGQRLSRR